jgi:hypothetical protein
MDSIQLQDAALKVSEEWKELGPQPLTLRKYNRWDRIEHTLLTTLLFSYKPSKNSQNYLMIKIRY